MEGADGAQRARAAPSQSGQSEGMRAAPSGTDAWLTPAPAMRAVAR